jgi:hypothetical protein
MTTSSSPWGLATPVKWPKTSLAPNFTPFQQEVARTNSVPLYQRVWDVWLVGSHPMVIRDSPLDFPLHPLLPFMITMSNSGAQQLQRWAIRGFMVTMATPAGRQWVLTYPTDPYYPKFLPTKPQPIPMPHNTLSSWLHPSYKNCAAISWAWLLQPCSLGRWTLPESALSVKLALSLFALLFGSNLTFTSVST